MTSIYRQAMGSDFDRLHPEIQRRFGLSSLDGLASIGTGVMDEVWRGRIYTLPFLYVGSVRSIMVPERGKNIPFRIENYAWHDQFGRETMSWLRTFDFPRCQRHFDATMIYSKERNCVVDYLGTHQHLAVDIELEVDERGGLLLRSGAQRFYEGPIVFTFPMLFSGKAEVHEWFDEDDSRFHISVNVTNRTWGPLFGYRGSFSVEWIQCDPADMPDRARPARAERRE